jgi:hypothetical protein
MDMDIKVARLFDGIGQDGVPFFADDRARIEDPEERERVGRYLLSGTMILRTTGRDVDYLDPDRKRSVGMSFRTDGNWLWSDALGHYAMNHGIAPDPDFYQHIRAQSYAPATPDEAAIRRALEVLQEAQASPRR